MEPRISSSAGAWLTDAEAADYLGVGKALFARLTDEQAGWLAPFWLDDGRSSGPGKRWNWLDIVALQRIVEGRGRKAAPGNDGKA